jgi:UDP-2-acetamido-2,6-beta-L-arabino-hexul-4-ose reductase
VRILITGANGFIGRNLKVRLQEIPGFTLVEAPHGLGAEELRSAVTGIDWVFHLAGVNRPQEEGEFTTGNVDFTRALCAALVAAGNRAPVVFASSSQAALDNPYGRSKRAAEDTLLEYSRNSGAPVFLYRLNNVFGKWCRPFYNSAVATFCHQAARDLPLSVRDPRAPLSLIYVDDVVDTFIRLLQARDVPPGHATAGPVYETTVGEVAEALREFAASRKSLMTPRVGVGLIRALYSTYISHLPTEAFAYTVPRYPDPRGEFVEMLKTPDTGQFSYFTAGPGITRGEHYHHSKVEKFLVVRGTARFDFRQVDTDERHSLVVRGGEGRIVESIPGWAHGVTNAGDDEVIIMLWANEVFDRQRPDTIASKVVS